MLGKVRNIYAGGHTAEGFYSLHASILQGLSRLFILQGPPGTGKSSLIKEVADLAVENGFDIEIIHNPSDHSSIDGMMIRTIGIGVVNGSSPYMIEPKYPGLVEEIINLGSALNREQLIQHKDQIIQLTDEINQAFSGAYDHFSKAKNIHFEREALYTNGMNYHQANQVTERLLERFLTNQINEDTPLERHLFFGAATPKGVVNYIDNLTKDLATRIIIKGRPGSGKSTMLKKLVERARESGISTEVFHCGFDPNSLDMVLFPHLQVAIYDGTAPHEMEATRPGDETIDMYQLCFDIDIDQQYSSELAQINRRYTEQTAQGIDKLAQAKKLNDTLESYYIEAMDFEQVQNIKERIVKEIFRS